MVDLSQAFDWIASTLIIATVLVGFIQVGSDLGSLSDIVSRMLNEPTTFGAGLTIFYLGFDTWTPAIPKTFLDSYGLGWLSVFYPFADGFVPHFSLETFIFSCIFAAIITLICLKRFDISFWFKGLLISAVTFLVGWYLWTLIAWNLMYVGGSMMGLSPDLVHQVWFISVSTTSSWILQYFFMFSIPISLIWAGRKVSHVVT